MNKKKTLVQNIDYQKFFFFLSFSESNIKTHKYTFKNNYKAVPP